MLPSLKSKRKFRLRCVLLMSFLFSCAFAFTQDGVIKGVVVNETGNPVATARVTTLPVDTQGEGEVRMGFMPTFFFITDEKGHFVVMNLVVGYRYKLYAKQESAGYPDMTLWFFNPKDHAVVETAQPKKLAVDTIVHLGSKAMVLMYDIKDKVTGNPIKEYSLHMERSDEGSSDGTRCVNNRCLIPSDASVKIEFSAPGYKTWYYPGVTDKAASTFMTTGPGQTTKLDVFLQPLPGKAQ